MTYTYTCPICGTIELNHSMTEQINECPTCGSEIKIVITGGSGIIYKASGFTKGAQSK